MGIVKRLTDSLNRETTLWAILVITVNLIAFYYGGEALQPYRIAFNILIVLYCIYRIRTPRSNSE
jgi:4-amino-4-deoxy-L-arabinose transferase-like glycosyltransferase